MSTISRAMRSTIEISAAKEQISREILVQKTNEMRGMVKNIKAFTTLLWNLKGISEGFFYSGDERNRKHFEANHGLAKVLAREQRRHDCTSVIYAPSLG